MRPPWRSLACERKPRPLSPPSPTAHCPPPRRRACPAPGAAWVSRRRTRRLRRRRRSGRNPVEAGRSHPTQEANRLTPAVERRLGLLVTPVSWLTSAPPAPVSGLGSLLRKRHHARKVPELGATAVKRNSPSRNVGLCYNEPGRPATKDLGGERWRSSAIC